MKNESVFFLRLSSVVQAIGYGVLTYFLVYRLLAREDVFVTYIVNIFLIIFILTCDGLARRFAEKRKSDIRSMYAEMGVFTKAVYMFSQGFIRTSLYMFYIVALILSGVNSLNPGLMPHELGGFFSSIEYGVILLFAFDTLISLLAKDKKWIKMNLGIGQSNEDS